MGAIVVYCKFWIILLIFKSKDGGVLKQEHVDFFGQESDVWQARE